MKKKYDAIIIGTGSGGGTVGFDLAKKGLNILFIEKGLSYKNNQSMHLGNYAETFTKQNDNETLKYSGRYFDTIIDSSSEMIPFMGLVTGGSTSLYGMAMERFFDNDFLPRKKTKLNNISNLPSDGWPIRYNDLAKYYKKAELIYNVKGIGDPLRTNEDYGYDTPPKIQKPNQELFDFFINKGLSPYILPRSCDFIDNCIECQGFLCPYDCKNDSFKSCVWPAVIKYGATLQPDCTVNKLIAKGDHVTGVVCKIDNNEIIYKSDIIILAAGAINTPLILFNSKNTQFADGLANKSGQVGKNLMRHLIDMFIIKTNLPIPKMGFIKEIAFNDLYYINDQKLGTFQSFGRLPPSEMLTETIYNKMSTYSKLVPNTFSLAKPLVSTIINRYFSNKIVMTSIMEDLPYIQNSISLNRNLQSPVLNYNIHPYEELHLKIFREHLTKIIKPYKHFMIKQAEENKRLAHVCGTCRMGNDDNTSVVNADCRSHDIKNLFIVDASVFPTSGGTNPALTIAANSLRVSDVIQP